MRGVVALLLLVPGAAAGFEVHEVTGPDDRVAPLSSGNITVDLDLDCSSAWLQDPYRITIDVVSDLTVEGPASVEAPMSACDGPQGIVEVFATFVATVPPGQAAYVPVAVNFTFASSDHPLEASQTEQATAAVIPDGAPALRATAGAADVLVEDEGNATVHVTNLGNAPADVAWEPLTTPGLSFSGVPRLEPGQEATGLLRFAPQGGWDVFTSQLVLESVDPEGARSAPVNVSVEWQPVPSEGRDSPFPVGLVLLVLAAAVRRR